jgi:hypothetical protein
MKSHKDAWGDSSETVLTVSTANAMENRWKRFVIDASRLSPG